MEIGNSRTSAIARIMAAKFGSPPMSALVVGCGSGREAAVLASEFGCNVTGIDLNGNFDPDAAQVVNLKVADATALEFGDESFDVVFSYHALEHIPDYHRALSEMKRVLRIKGTYCIGTPNRHRILGYLGGGSSLRQKIQWNIADFTARLRGRFRNEFGAHAGYSAEELRSILAQHFSASEDVTEDYYRNVYRRHPLMMGLIAATQLGNWVYPSVYFVGRR